MLIHAEGWNRGSAPVKLYYREESGGSIIVGDARTRIFITREEAEALYRLLGEFLNGKVSVNQAP